MATQKQNANKKAVGWSRSKEVSGKVLRRPWAWVMPVFLLAPLGLGAKGCDAAVVGEDCSANAGAGANCSKAGSPGTGGSALGNGGSSPGSGGSVLGSGGSSPGTGGSVLGSGGSSPGSGGKNVGSGGRSEGTGGRVGTAGSGSGGATAARDCGGLRGLSCEKGEYCNYPAAAQCGAADQMGTCEPIPQACDTIYDPVCGCDGVTYGNDCEAAMASVSVASEAACADDPGTACGARLGDTCAEGEYCNYPIDAICGRADATGVCTVQPKACTKESNPVCGCDGLDYGNPCMAAAAGVSVDYVGRCKTDPGTGEMCGGLLGLQCNAKNEFCDYPIETMCGSGDQMGVCRPMPEACTLDYKPVCGCDGKTYSNACAAAGAGVSVASNGECAKP